MSVLLKLIYRFDVISNKILGGFFLFGRNWQNDLKIYVDLQKTQDSQNNFDKEQSWGIYTSWFQNLYKTYSQDNVTLV